MREVDRVLELFRHCGRCEDEDGLSSLLIRILRDGPCNDSHDLPFLPNLDYDYHLSAYSTHSCVINRHLVSEFVDEHV